MCNHNNGRSTNLTYMRRRGFFSPKKRSRHPFSSTFDLSLQLFFKISTQLERKFLQIANHEEQSCSILVPHTFPRLSVRSSTNSRSPLSVENFVSATLSPRSPLCAAPQSTRTRTREARERKRERGEEEKRKKKERLINIYAAHGASI